VKPRHPRPCGEDLHPFVPYRCADALFETVADRYTPCLAAAADPRDKPEDDEGETQHAKPRHPRPCGEDLHPCLTDQCADALSATVADRYAPCPGTAADPRDKPEDDEGEAQHVKPRHPRPCGEDLHPCLTDQCADALSETVADRYAPPLPPQQILGTSPRMTRERRCRPRSICGCRTYFTSRSTLFSTAPPLRCSRLS